MKEDLLHYIWQYQKFSKVQLQTSDGESIAILSVGVHNFDAGPDFSNANIKIGEVRWSGAVEIHIKSSDWQKHKHHLDAAYDQVILHVVWENDAPAYRSDGTQMPVLEVQQLVDLQIIQQYQQYFQESYQQQRKLLCAAHIPQIKKITIVSAQERALVSRLNKKAAEVLQWLEANQGDWQMTIVQWLFKGFGFKKNADPMVGLSRSIPHKLLLKYQNSLTDLEALLMGQAGFITLESSHGYWKALQDTYDFQRHKFQLDHAQQVISVWKFARMRPANFPTIRLAQLAAFLHQHAHRLDILLSITYPEVLKVFSHEPSSFWQHHYHPQRQSSVKNHTMGAKSIENLVINVVAPLQYAYAIYYQDMDKAENVFDTLQKLSAEENSIVSMYIAAGFPVKSAYDTQAVIGLYQELCQKHRCLACGIGDHIFRHISPNQLKAR